MGASPVDEPDAAPAAEPTAASAAAPAAEPAALAVLRTRILNVFKAQGQKPPAEMGVAAVWLAQGYGPDLIAAVIDEGLSRNGKVRSLKYFNSALAEAANASPAPPAANPKSLHAAAERLVERLSAQEAQQHGQAQRQPPLLTAARSATDHAATRLLSKGRGR